MVCLILVPQTTANLNVLGTVDNSVNISIDVSPPAHLCWESKYVITIALRMNGMPTTENWRTLSSMIIGEADLSGKNKTYQIVRTNLSYGYKNETSCSNYAKNQFLKQGVSLNVTFDDLIYFSNYSIMTHLCNNIGCGDASNPVMIQTKEYLPTCPPSDIRYQNTTLASLVLTWNELPLNCANSIIMGFNILLMRMRYQTTNQSYTILKTIEFKDLAIYELYCANISASTRIGNGPSSKPICRYTNENSKYWLLYPIKESSK